MHGCQETDVGSDGQQKRRVTPSDAMVSRRLGKLRTLTGLTQADLAQRLGLTHQQVQKYESGRNRVSAGRAWDIARALGVPITALFDDEAGLPDQDAAARERTGALMRAFGRIPHGRVQAAMVRLVEAVADGEEAGTRAR